MARSIESDRPIGGPNNQYEDIASIIGKCNCIREADDGFLKTSFHNLYFHILLFSRSIRVTDPSRNSSFFDPDPEPILLRALECSVYEVTC